MTIVSIVEVTLCARNVRSEVIEVVPSTPAARRSAQPCCRQLLRARMRSTAATVVVHLLVVLCLELAQPCVSVDEVSLGASAAGALAATRALLADVLRTSASAGKDCPAGQQACKDHPDRW